MSIDAIAFQTTAVPNAGAGEYYNTIIYFQTAGNAALPDTFDVLVGELPAGMSLIADREDNDNDGQPDSDGALTGNARLIGFPRVQRAGLPYSFTVKAISTGQLATTPQPPGAPALAAEQPFQIEVFEGRINVLNPTFQVGSNDPAVPAFPDVINFVNPADPQAFFSFAFETAGGSGNNVLVVYLPRELELSVFDTLASKNPDGSIKLEEDTLETAETNDPFDVYFSDGGVFNVQAGSKKVQIGGFQSPRGELGKITDLNPEWFQRTRLNNGPPVNSRRDFADTDNIGLTDNTLGAEQPIAFSDYFDARYEGTTNGWTAPDAQPDLKRRKYPFVAGEYTNAFFQRFDSNIHQTPLRFNGIVEAVDTRGTASKVDDLIARKAYVVQVKIPDIVIDSVFIDGGTAGVDYNVFVGASGGVPPLRFDLEWVDEFDDASATKSGKFPAGYNGPDPLLTKDLLGVDLDSDKGSFFGYPRASGVMDLSVRVFASVMNPTQQPPNGTDLVPTGGVDVQGRQNEWNGWHPISGEAGIHKTFRVTMLNPSLPAVLNSSLDPGVDGSSYRASDGSGNVILRGIGGVANLVPYPVGFGPNYPANPTVSYDWVATHDQDPSYLAPEIGKDGLPNSLTLDGDKDSATNGEISGVALDRGFHPIYVIQRDVYVGDTAASSPPIDPVTAIQEVSTTMGLSVSPDTALYLRGLQASEGTGGVASGLLDSANTNSESRMVPMFLQAQLFQATTGEPTPEILQGLPPKADILPIGIPNGGSDLNLNKSMATIQGFWPGEAGKELDWGYSGNRAFRHNQQELTWLQVPNKEQTRVFMWGETAIKKWSSGAQNGVGMYGKRYQSYVSTGTRGVLVVEPRTGNFWVPATFDNTAGDADGSWFGSEFVQSPVSQGYYQSKAPYRGWYYYSTRDYADYDHHGQGGLGNYIENLSTSSASGTGWYAYDLGRGGVSVAISDDGLWCATAMAGGDQQKIAIWRTDGKPIDEDDNVFAGGNVVAVDGIDKDGNTLTDSAGIINLGGNTGNDNDILPDSLKFVEGGLIFLRYTTTSSSSYSMDSIFGFSLKNGDLSNVNVQTARQNLSGVSSGPALFGNREVRYIPDQDQINGLNTSQTCLSQWSWSSNDAAPGESGPNAIAFTAGRMYDVERNSYTGSIDREGFRVEGNRNQSLFFMELDGTGSGGLDLGGVTTKITDLTGNDSDIYGDLLTPGRPGERLDFMRVSSDGKYVAIVRDWTIADSSSFSFYNRRPTFSHYYMGTSVETAMPSHDLLLFSTPVMHADDSNSIPGDLDTVKDGRQHVLFIGQRSNTTIGGSGPGSLMPAYASANNLINAKFRRIRSLEFSEDNTKLLFEYAGHNSYSPLGSGYLYGWSVNPTGQSSQYYYQVGTAMIAQFNFRTSSDGPIKINASGLILNPLKGLTSTDNKKIASIGPTGAKFGPTNPDSKQNFWASFRSPNGEFLYYVSDSLGGPAHMFGINMTKAAIVSPEGKSRAPYVAFALHPQTINFEQFEANGFNYESRFAASPAGTTLGSGPLARDADGIVFVTASAAGGSQTNLEVYVFDANRGGELKVLTADVTTGSVNAINNLYVSMDANTLVGQRASTSSTRDSRSAVTSQTDLFAVTNVHQVLGGATPNAFIVSSKASHGSSIALVGEGTATGAQAIIYSRATTSGNASWDDRQLYVSVLAPAAARTSLDQTKSHYAILAGGRKLDDNPNTAD